MATLARPEDAKTVEIPARRAIVAADTEVLVVGGGPAGLGAALGAAGTGAEVLLVERYGFLGGNATAALVMPLVSFYTQTQAPAPQSPLTLFPGDHGQGDPVIAGALRMFLERLVRAGGAIPPSLKTGYTVPFDPEIFKWIAMEMVAEAGVRLLFHSFASDVLLENGRIRGVVFETKSGPLVILARTVVDCTGDGDIAARAGAPFEVGRPEDGLVQPMTLMFRMAEFQRAAFEAYVTEHSDQWRGVYGLWDLIGRAAAAGDLSLPRENILFFATPHERELVVNSTRVIHVLGTEVWDLSYAEWESRRQMRQIVSFFRKYVPGFAESYALQSGVQVGVRETRRIRGEYRLTEDDLLRVRKFPDVIARGTYPLDIHSPDGKGTVLKRLPPGEAYDIPLRSLLPLEVEALLVAGRCISGSHGAHSSYRAMPISMATGQAAGVAAALAAKRGTFPRQLSAETVQTELLRQGADLGDSERISDLKNNR
ncbi:MAG: FAD-dependent oxidoreductase [Syntrophotaleaceae bacterium]